jgi:hypothetical protein
MSQHTLQNTLNKSNEAFHDFIKDVESRHFRTVHDTGANDCAMLVWNIVRDYAGLPRITRDDLPKWCENCRKYHKIPHCAPQFVG